jgi:hypothetical protein
MQVVVGKTAARASAARTKPTHPERFTLRPVVEGAFPFYYYERRKVPRLALTHGACFGKAWRQGGG